MGLWFWHGGWMIANRRYRVLIGLARCAALLAPWLAGPSCGYPALEPPRPSSCDGLPATCGATAGASCCEAAMVPGGAFLRGYDQASDSTYKDMDHGAT